MRIGIEPGISVLHPARNILLKGLMNPAEKKAQIANYLDTLLPHIENESSSKKVGAVGDGITDDRAKFVTLSASTEFYVNDGVYKLSSEYDFPLKNSHVRVHPNARFTNAAFDMGPIVRAIGANPVLAYDAAYYTIDSNYAVYEHVVGHSIFMVADTTDPVVVSLYSNCEVKQGHGFGANFGAFVTGPGTGVVLEIDSHVTHASGIGVGLAIDSIGDYPSETALVIQPNGPNSPFKYGLAFNNASGNNAIVEEMVRVTGPGSAKKYLYAPADMMFTQAVIETNVFIAGPSVESYNGLLRVDASASAAPKLSAVGSATDIGILHQTKGLGSYQFLGGDGVNRLYLTGNTGATYPKLTNGSGGFTLEPAGTDTTANSVIRGKGTGTGVDLLDGAGSSRLKVTTAGYAFNGANPGLITVVGSRGGNAALASLLTHGAARGLWTDNTTA